MGSPHDSEHHRRKKTHKRHHAESLSEEEGDSNRRRHHKHHHRREKERRTQSDREEDESVGYTDGRDADDGRIRHKGKNRNHGSPDRVSRGEENGRSHHHRHRPRRASAEFDPAIRIKKEKDDHNYEEQQRERYHHDHHRREARRGRDRAGGDHGLNTETPQVKTEPGLPQASAGNSFGKENKDGVAPEERQQPNFELSGKLTEDTNTFRGVVIKYNEPQEAMKPKRKWRLYPFKGEESLPVLHIHRQSAFLLGRDRRIADIPVDHPSCSKQQAVLQFRAMPYTRPDGNPGRRVRPYIIDLESANGTYLNGEKVDARRYYELKEKDVLKFGYSSREYVVLHDAVDLSEVADGHDMEEA